MSRPHYRTLPLLLCGALSGCTTERLDAIYRLGASDAMGAPSEAGTPDGATPSDGASESASDAPVAKGYLRTSGSKILDSSGQPVRLTGISWYGLETTSFAPAGLWIRTLSDLMGQIKGLSYNSVRLPISFRLLDADTLANGINDQVNPGLNGLTGLQMLDRVITEAEVNGLRVIVCQEVWTAGGPDEGLWYDATHSEDDWVARWRELATRYKNRPAVIGFELHNAPENTATANPTWGDGGTADWKRAAEKAGNVILDANPDVLIFVDGVEQVGDKYYWYGGNLLGVATTPVRLNVPNRVVYATHEYPRSLHAQPWFSSDANYADLLPPVWDQYWGYLLENDVAPVWIAEFGTTSSELPWLSKLLGYASIHRVNFAYKAFNPNTDTRIGGILADDWLTVNQDKQQLLAPGLAPLIP
jgi:aryl-phospho-beta-D-glucosidase BglC (GH1 family)